MNRKDVLAKIKAIFAGTDPATDPAVTDVTVKAKDGSNVINYSTDTGGPAFVDVSDDGIPGIDQGDALFSDASLTTPYPDGTYKVTGTDFSFTVAAGVVSSVTDPNGTGAGTPNAAADPATITDPAATATDPTLTANAFKAIDITPENIQAMFASFAAGTPEERLNNLEVICKALMEYNFGWQLREAQQKQLVDNALNTYKSTLENVTAMASKHEKIIPGLFEIVDEVVDMPGKAPDTLTGNKKDKFDRQQKREKALEGVAAAITKMKEENKK
jgi:hypothetical protein